MIKIKGIILLSLLLVSFSILNLNAQTGHKLPNVVIIYADDMGFGDLGANNPKSKIPTPNLDKLASQGIRFTDAHSSSGICSPSRFSLLTGEHHWRRFYKIVGAFGESAFKPDDYTLAKMFKSKGYNTAAIGKWHLGWGWDALRNKDVPAQELTFSNNTKGDLFGPENFNWTKPIPNGPLAQGFDYYFGDGTINFPPYCWVENDKIVEAPTVMMDEKTFKKIKEGDWQFRPGPMVKGWDPYKVLPTITDKAVNWIEKQNENEPFFLYFALPSPHAPIIPNDEYQGKSDAGPYGDFVFESDVMAGRIINALKKKGLDKNTIIVFTTDNGAEKFAYERVKKYDHWSSEPLRGLKRDVWEGGHRVPFVISWPGHIKAGAVSDETISQVDFAATFAKIVGYKLTQKEAMDSYDLLPLLKGKKYKEPLRVATVQNTYEDKYALRQGDWMFIDSENGRHSWKQDWFEKSRGYTKDTTPGLLYNLKEDVDQHNNLYSKYPKKVKTMKALLETYKAGKGCAPHSK